MQPKPELPLAGPHVSIHEPLAALRPLIITEISTGAGGPAPSNVQCLKCQRELIHQKFISRRVDSRFGSLLLWRRYGWCPHCEGWQFPADHALGLGRQAPASPTTPAATPG